MERLKKILQKGKAAVGRSKVAHSRFGIWLPAGTALLLVALLLNLGLTQFLFKGYLAQDGFAVPQDGLSALLRDQKEMQPVQLLGLDMGDAVYTRGLGANDYYIGEDKVCISSGYPMYTQSGQVLYFLDDGLKLVTEDWETLDTYEGLYLSDGVTFNADRSQADISKTMLVQVEGGYQVAQETTISSTMRDSVIPMNSVCAFEEGSVVYYAYQAGGGLAGSQVQVPSDASITIGGRSYGYLEFLEKLGFWEEKNDEPQSEPEIEPEPVPEVPEEPDEETGGHGQTKPGAQQPGEGELIVEPIEPQEPQKPEKGEKEEGGKKEPDGSKQPKPPSDVLEKPGAPIENPNATPGKPAPPAPPVDTNPEYRDPEVSFSSELRRWVYTLSTTASISDPAHVLVGGVQIYVYKVADDGKESQVLRRAVSSSGAVTLGQLEPASKFHVVAKYSYNDKYNYPQKKELDLGTATTLPFDQAGSIRLSYYDEQNVPVGSAPVEIFSKSLQMRDLVFPNVGNGITTQDGGVTTHPDTDPAKAETYVNAFIVTAEAREGNSRSELKMSASALRLLREGYQLSHWETPEQLKTGTYYDYTITMQDRYGNEFSIVGVEGGRDPRAGSGHTCKDAPSVQIRVPSSENVSGSTRIDVTWKNPDASPVEANDQSGAQMGSEIKAALYLVKQGDVVAPENAVDLSGHTLAEPETTVNGKFLPVTINSDATVTTVSTSWVITNLPVLTNYTAGVLCGYYNCDDGRVHRDETLKETTDFLTASLANLGSISYTAQVDQVTHQEGRLMFRMDKADVRLLKLLSTVAFSVEERGTGNSVGTITLNKSELSAAAIAYTRDGNDAITGNEATATVQFHLNGEETARTVEMGLLWTELPQELENGGAPANVWDFLLATSAASARNECWLTMTLGSTLSADGGLTPPRLLELAPKTAYVGRFTTKASQGGVEEDVTSGSSKPVYFTTLSQAATVYVQNAFVSTDFIELYGVSFTDPDECIMPDNADRGGNNVAIRIFNENGVQVATKYINSQESYQSVRISGLETDQEYTMCISALRYTNGGTVEKMYDLPFDQPQDEENPTVYKFTTGESVVGDLALLSVSQLYQNADFSSSASLSLLSENDFYQGVWQDGNYLYYSTNHEDPESADYGTDTSVLEAYLAQARQTELYYDTDETLRKAIEEGNKYMQNRPYTRAQSNQTWLKRQEDSWTSRFIKVSPGEQYVIYNTSSTDNFRINFYYKSVENGVEYLRSYGALSSGYFMQGNVFEVPSTAGGGTPASDQICYMRISGFYQRTRESLIFEKYDPTSTEGSPDLTQGVQISEGMNLNQYNAVGYNKTYAYTDYIPVTSGSVYELKGRDPNIDLTAAKRTNTGSNSYVLFYARDYTFLGSYVVANQTALVKAPFGAAYCRFNLFMDQSEKDEGGNTIIKLNRDALSMRLHKSAKQDEYMATLRLRLSDQSAPEKQLLKPGGTYTVTLYTTTSSVADSDDLEKQAYTILGVKTVPVTEADVDHDQLNLVAVQTFDGLTPNMGFKAVLSIEPESWNGGSVVLDTVYFTSNRVVHTISKEALNKSSITGKAR